MAKLQQDKVEVERKLQETTTELKAELQNRDSEFEELKARLHDTTAELHKWRAGDVLIDESNSSSSRTWWRARVAELKTEIQKLETENAELRAALYATNLIKSVGGEEMEALRARLHETEKLRVTAEEELDDECETTQRQGHEIEELQTERAKLDKEAKSLRQELISRTEEKGALQKEKEELEQQLEIARSDKEALEDELKSERGVSADYAFHNTLKMGDFVAVMHAGSDNGDDYWLASVIGTKPKQHEIHVMYYEEAGDSGYRGWANGKTQWIKESSVRARIDGLPATGLEREALQAELHAPDE
jgi:predicted  nucleic acid-binding Zn-ribbon protein